jgi:hypothetical protein
MHLVLDLHIPPDRFGSRSDPGSTEDIRKVQRWISVIRGWGGSQRRGGLFEYLRYTPQRHYFSTGIYTPRLNWVVRGTGTPKDRDEVNRIEFCECDV